MEAQLTALRYACYAERGRSSGDLLLDVLGRAQAGPEGADHLFVQVAQRIKSLLL
jgi:hypothetical protein